MWLVADECIKSSVELMMVLTAIRLAWLCEGSLSKKELITQKHSVLWLNRLLFG